MGIIWVIASAFEGRSSKGNKGSRFSIHASIGKQIDSISCSRAHNYQRRLNKRIRKELDQHAPTAVMRNPTCTMHIVSGAMSRYKTPDGVMSSLK